MATPEPKKTIDLKTLSLGHLNHLKARVKGDVKNYGRSYTLLKNLEQKFEDSKYFIEQISKTSEIGADIMIPISPSVYVPGKLKDTNSYIIQIGANFFVSYSYEGALQHCNRQVEFSKTSSSHAEKRMNEKRKFIQAIDFEISKKSQERHEQALKHRAEKAAQAK